MGLHGRLVLGVIHPTNRRLCQSNGGEDDDHQFDTIETLAAIFVGQVAKYQLTHGRTGESQGIDRDFDVGFVFRAPIDECQTWQDDIRSEQVIGVSKEPGGGDSLFV